MGLHLHYRQAGRKIKTRVMNFTAVVRGRMLMTWHSPDAHTEQPAKIQHRLSTRPPAGRSDKHQACQPYLPQYNQITEEREESRPTRLYRCVRKWQADGEQPMNNRTVKSALWSPFCHLNVRQLKGCKQANRPHMIYKLDKAH